MKNIYFLCLVIVFFQSCKPKYIYHEGKISKETLRIINSQMNELGDLIPLFEAYSSLENDSIFPLINLGQIWFHNNSSTIKPIYFEALDKIATILKKYPSLKLVIEGQQAGRNPKIIQRIDLGYLRAKSVKEYLIENYNIPEQQLISIYKPFKRLSKVERKYLNKEAILPFQKGGKCRCAKFLLVKNFQTSLNTVK